MFKESIMIRFGIKELNQTQLRYIDKYNKDQDKLLHAAMILTILALLIDKVNPNIYIPQILSCLTVIFIFVVKIWMYISLKKKLLSLVDHGSVIRNEGDSKVTKEEKRCR